MKLRICVECSKAFYSTSGASRHVCTHCGFIVIDKRFQKRIKIKKKMDVTLRKGREEILARVVDYSEDGAKISYKGEPFGIGAVMNIEVPELDIHRPAKTMWTKRLSRSSVSVGLSLL